MVDFLADARVSQNGVSLRNLTDCCGLIRGASRTENAGIVLRSSNRWRPFQQIEAIINVNMCNVVPSKTRTCKVSFGLSSADDLSPKWMDMALLVSFCRTFAQDPSPVGFWSSSCS